MERETQSEYVLNCAPIKSNKGQLKSQGSGKIGNQYSVHIKAAENSSSKMVTVKYCSRHYNHACALAFLRLPEKTKLQIACKLQNGISIERSLDDIRDSCENTLNREHLVTRQDIRNMRLQFNTKGIMRHSNDLYLLFIILFHQLIYIMIIPTFRLF